MAATPCASCAQPVEPDQRACLGVAGEIRHPECADHGVRVEGSPAYQAHMRVLAKLEMSALMDAAMRSPGTDATEDPVVRALGAAREAMIACEARRLVGGRR